MSDINYALEYAKYIKNPIYCIEQNFETLDNTQGGYVKYKLFGQQKKLIKAYDKHRHNIVAKPRQAGISTTTAAYLAVKIALSTPSKPQAIEILANNLVQAQEFLSKIREFTTQIPTWVWGKYYNYNKANNGHIIGKGAAKRIEFMNGSYVAAKPCTKDALRGTAPTYLVIDEAAFVENGAETYAAAAAATSTGGKMILISTPNGRDELYYKTYINAMSKKNRFNIVRLHWALDPRYNKGLEWIEHDLAGEEIRRFKEEDFSEKSMLDKLDEGFYPVSKWFEDMCADMNHDKRRIAQELEVKFEGSAGNVIEPKKIEYYRNKIVKEPEREEGFDRNVWIWKDPLDEHRYIAGADPATGDGKDYSTFSIVDLDTMEVVLEYQGQASDEQLSEIIYKYANDYSAMTVIDRTGGYSNVVIHLLESWDFKHFYRSEFSEDVTEEHKENKNSKIGFLIQKHRHSAISHFSSLIEDKKIKCYSIRQVNEWETFVWLNGRADHQRGFHDDLIMSLVMPLWVAQTVYKRIEKAKSMGKKMISSFLNANITAKDIENRKSGKTKKLERLQKTYGDDYWVMAHLLN